MPSLDETIDFIVGTGSKLIGRKITTQEAHQLLMGKGASVYIGHPVQGAHVMQVVEQYAAQNQMEFSFACMELTEQGAAAFWEYINKNSGV